MSYRNGKNVGWLLGAMNSMLEMLYQRDRHIGTPTMQRRRSRRAYGPGLTGTLVRVCPGGRHAWYQTACGIIRKPYASAK